MVTLLVEEKGVKIVIHAIKRNCVTPFAMFFKNLKRVFALIAFQNDGPRLLFKTVLKH